MQRYAIIDAKISPLDNTSLSISFVLWLNIPVNKLFVMLTHNNLLGISQTRLKGVKEFFSDKTSSGDGTLNIKMEALTTKPPCSPIPDHFCQKLLIHILLYVLICVVLLISHQGF